MDDRNNRYDLERLDLDLAALSPSEEEDQEEQGLLENPSCSPPATEDTSSEPPSYLSNYPPLYDEVVPKGVSSFKVASSFDIILDFEPPVLELPVEGDDAADMKPTVARLVIRPVVAHIPPFNVEIDVSLTVLDLKRRICSVYPSEPEAGEQRLRYCGRVLADEYLIGSFLQPHTNIIVLTVLPFTEAGEQSLRSRQSMETEGEESDNPRMMWRTFLFKYFWRLSWIMLVCFMLFLVLLAMRLDKLLTSWTWITVFSPVIVSVFPWAVLWYAICQTLGQAGQPLHLFVYAVLPSTLGMLPVMIPLKLDGVFLDLPWSIQLFPVWLVLVSVLGITYASRDMFRNQPCLCVFAAAVVSYALFWMFVVLKLDGVTPYWAWHEVFIPFHALCLSLLCFIVTALLWKTHALPCVALIEWICLYTQGILVTVRAHYGGHVSAWIVIAPAFLGALVLLFLRPILVSGPRFSVAPAEEISDTLSQWEPHDHLT